MNKKDIYEHLARIYLDASQNKTKKIPSHPLLFKNPFFIIATIIFLISILAVFILNKNQPVNSEVTLVLQSEATKINFNFDPAKKEIYSINLNSLNLTRFKALGFSVKKTHYTDNLYLRVELTNNFNEKSEFYIKDITHKWKNYLINLDELKNISNWSEMRNLSFIVEEWNVKEKKGVVYIDNIKFLK